MDGAGHLIQPKHRDCSLHLPPMAEMDHVSERTAAVGARGRLQLRELAKIGDELRCFPQRRPVLNVDMVVHANFPNSFLLRRSLAGQGCEKPHLRRERRIHHASGWRKLPAPAMTQAMNRHRKSGTQAGGFWLAGAIIAGVIGGILVGQASIGFLVGAASGTLIAVLLWLRDRREEY